MQSGLSGQLPQRSYSVENAFASVLVFYDNYRRSKLLSPPDLAKIATLNPNLAAAAAYLGDPEQTSAMARFAEGKMSYAEMRGLCG